MTVFICSVCEPMYEDVVHVWLHIRCCASLPDHLCSTYGTMYGTMYVIMFETMYGVMGGIMYGDAVHVCCHVLCYV